MTDKPTHRDRLKGTHPSQGKAPPPATKEGEDEVTEASCAAFGYLRGLREASASVEFRFRDGNSIWFPYGLMGAWQYIPSEGLLLKFSGDVGYIVLIRGSNLDKPLIEGSINLTNAGLQRHRVLWIREMTQEDVQRVGETGPTIDSIDVGEFTSKEERREWIKNNAPSFLTEWVE